MDPNMIPAPQETFFWQTELSLLQDLKLIFENEFTNSFEGFTASWRRNCVFSFSPTVVTTIREKVSCFSTEEVLQFVDWLLIYLDINFVAFQVYSILERGYADDDFFNIILAVIDYLKEAIESVVKVLNVDTTTQEYQQKFSSVDLETYLIKKSMEALLMQYKERIMSTIRRRVRHLRKYHSYHSAFWNSFSGTDMAKVFALLKSNLPEEIRSDFSQRYETELIHDVKEYVKKIPETISENRFLLIMRDCINVEQSVYSSLIAPNAFHFSVCKASLLDMFRDQHARRRAGHIFKDMDSELVNPEAKFDVTYFRDLYALYVFRGDQETVEGIQQLYTLIQKSFLKVIETHVIPLGEARDEPSLREILSFEPGQREILSFRVALEEISKRYDIIRERLSELAENMTQSEVLMKTLDNASSRLSPKGLPNTDHRHQLRAEHDYAISFLSNCNLKSDDELVSLSVIANYFVFLSDHEHFMNHLYKELRIMAIQRVRLPLVRLNTFSSWRNVNGKIPKKVKCLIQDLNASLGMGGNDRTAFRDTSSDLKCNTCLVTRSRYWGLDKDQSKLLRTLPQAVGIQETLTAHLEGRIDEDREITPMHCLSRVVLKTTLFTRGRKFTRLDMLQHQSMILMICEEKGPIRVSDIVRSVCVEKFETQNERERAEKYVGDLVESLRRPYPLLLKIAEGSTSSAEDAVVCINHRYAFKEEEVRLPGDYLLLKEPSWL